MNIFTPSNSVKRLTVDIQSGCHGVHAVEIVERVLGHGSEHVQIPYRQEEEMIVRNSVPQVKLKNVNRNA